MNEQNEIIPDGIEICEDKCPCGAHLRLHTHTFQTNSDRQKKFYIDCANHCGRVTMWNDSIDASIEEFDREYPN